MNVFLKMFDVDGEVADEGFEKEGQVGEEVVADDEGPMGAELLGDGGKFGLDFLPLGCRVCGGLVVEPFGIDAGEVTAS